MSRLIIRPGAIGDCILALPAMEALRPSEVWVSSPNVPLIRFVDRVCPIASTGLDLLGVPDVEPPRGLIERLRTFDSIVSWYGENRAEFRAAVEKLGLPFRFLRALPREHEGTNAVDFFLEQVGAAPAVPRIPCPREDGGFAVIHPFSGSPRKNWPLENYRELARRLPVPVRWCAGPEEALEDAVRIDHLYELACWLGRARLFIGNDSGIAHLAAAVGTPVVAIFIVSDPRVWGPRGECVRVLQRPQVEEVLTAAAGSLLSSG